MVDAARLERERVRGQISRECKAMAVFRMQALPSTGLGYQSFLGEIHSKVEANCFPRRLVLRILQ